MRSLILGRDEELAVVDSFLDSVRAGPAALLLHGEPGVGKTTVWQGGLELLLAKRFRALSTRPSAPEASLYCAGLGDVLDEVLDDALPHLPLPQAHALEIGS